VEPRIKTVGITQAAKVLPRPDERLLHDVLGKRCVAHDQSGGGIQAVHPRCRQQRERIEIPVPRSLYEISLDRSVLKPGACRRRYRFWGPKGPVCSESAVEVSGDPTWALETTAFGARSRQALVTIVSSVGMSTAGSRTRIAGSRGSAAP
jgi:hypothetical protein